MTHQETFDTVLAHLRKQGGPAYENNKCRYRTSDGKSCAAGCLIPDEDYIPGLEGTTAWAVPVQVLLSKQGHDPELVDSLQHVHDLAATQWSNFEPDMQMLARRWGLTYVAP